MLYSKQIPDALIGSPDTTSFIAFMDSIQKEKDSIIFKANRLYNPVLLTNLDFLRKLLNEFGYPPVPNAFPKKILDNMYLNAERVFRLKGSSLGLEYLIKVLTCGDCDIDASKFFPKDSYIILNDIENGYLFTETDYPNDILYLFDGVDSFITRKLDIHIRTPYFEMQELKDYINKHIFKFIGFVDENTMVNITFESGPFIPNIHANPFFEDVTQ